MLQCEAQMWVVTNISTPVEKQSESRTLKAASPYFIKNLLKFLKEL